VEARSAHKKDKGNIQTGEKWEFEKKLNRVPEQAKGGERQKNWGGTKGW